MKMTIKDKTISFAPENNDEIFMLGRISKNMKCKITEDRQRLKQKITDFEINISYILEMLAEGIIPKENENA